MFYTTEKLIEAAKSIRPFLERLVGSEAAALDTKLAILIARYKTGEAVDDAVTELLIQHDNTREWVRQFFEQDTTQGLTRSYEPLPGIISSTTPPKYVCPVGDDYIWYRYDVSEPVKRCPTHDVTLTLVQDT
jgi:hypothetical protein